MVQETREVQAQGIRPSAIDPPEVEAWLWGDFSGDYAWDVGSNCGQSVVHLAQECFRFTALEPCEASYEYYKAHFASPIQQIAVSDHDGEVQLAFPAREQKETGQLVTPGLRGMEWSPEDWSTAETVVVPCRSVDSLVRDLGTPDFIKVDTEGHEVYVLVGAKQLIRGGKTSFLIEFHSPGNQALCETILEVAGYRTEVVRHPYYEVGSAMWLQHGWLKGFSPAD